MRQQVRRVQEPKVDREAITKRVDDPEEVVVAQHIIKLREDKDALNAKIAALTSPILEKIVPVEKDIAVEETKLLALMRKKKLLNLEVMDYTVSVMPDITTEIDSKAFFDFMKARKQADEAWGYLKVQITAARKFLGEAVLSKVWTRDIEPFGSIKLRKTKVKK